MLDGYFLCKFKKQKIRTGAGTHPLKDMDYLLFYIINYTHIDSFYKECNIMHTLLLIIL